MHPVALGGETPTLIAKPFGRQPWRTRRQCFRGRKSHSLQPGWQQALGPAARAVAVHMLSPAIPKGVRTRLPRLVQPLKATSAADAAADSHGMRDYDSIEVCSFPY